MAVEVAAGSRVAPSLSGLHTPPRIRGGAAVCLPALPSGAGTALGGRFGAGTVAFALLIGPSIEAWFWLVRHAQPTAPASAAPVTAFDL
jgi:hypothetical protein